MKKKYFNPTFEVFRCELQAVICGSGGENEGIVAGDPNEEAPHEAEAAGYRSSLWR